MARKSKRKSKKSSKRSGGAKPRSQWSKAYRARIERAERKGLSRQAARGHHAKEHVSRKEAKGLTAGQSHSIAAFARAQARKAIDEAKGYYPDPDKAAATLKQYVREHGIAAFRALQAEEKRLHKLPRVRHRVRRKGKRGTLHISTGGNMADMEAFIEQYELPEMEDADQFAWLFYH
jgi:hypothetical protein